MARRPIIPARSARVAAAALFLLLQAVPPLAAQEEEDGESPSRPQLGQVMRPDAPAPVLLTTVPETAPPIVR